MSINPPLIFNKIPKQIAITRNKIGKGLSLSFHKNGQPALFVIRLLSQLEKQLTDYLRTNSGYMTVDDPCRLLQLLSAVPIQHEDLHTDSVYWPLAVNRLDTPLKSLFGQLEISPSPEIITQWTYLHWQVILNEQTEQIIEGGYCGLAETTLEHWLAQNDWQRSPSVLPNIYEMCIPVILANINLSLDEWQSLAPTDVIMIHHPLFDEKGIGYITINNQCLDLHYLGQCQYSLTASREIPSYKEEQMSEPSDNQATNTSDNNTSDLDPDIPETSVQSPLINHVEQLPMNFSIEVGQLKIPINQVQQLAPGSVLTAQGVTPGHAYLRYGKHIVARGTLVDVDGCLGLQLDTIEVEYDG